MDQNESYKSAAISFTHQLGSRRSHPVDRATSMFRDLVTIGCVDVVLKASGPNDVARPTISFAYPVSIRQRLEGVLRCHDVTLTQDDG